MKKKLIILFAVVFVLLLGVLALIGLLQKPEPVEEEVYPNPIATITMADGSVMNLELYPQFAPNTVANFISLANRGFYDGQLFFRTVSGVFIQAGDPLNNGTGSAGYAIKGEFSENGFTSNVLSHTRGAISMAHVDDKPDSASSQFFIMQGSYPSDYDGKYAVFGRMIDDGGYSVLDAIAASPTDVSRKPILPCEIATIRVNTFGAEYELETIQLDD